MTCKSIALRRIEARPQHVAQATPVGCVRNLRIGRNRIPHRHWPSRSYTLRTSSGNGRSSNSSARASLGTASFICGTDFPEMAASLATQVPRNKAQSQGTTSVVDTWGGRAPPSLFSSKPVPKRTTRSQRKNHLNQKLEPHSTSPLSSLLLRTTPPSALRATCCLVRTPVPNSKPHENTSSKNCSGQTQTTSVENVRIKVTKTWLTKQELTTDNSSLRCHMKHSELAEHLQTYKIASKKTQMDMQYYSPNKAPQRLT